jgi:threonine dehydrogenase-like Zn-dependent dehydrogenase
MTGNYRRCRVGRAGTRLAACGFIPTSIKPSLWGGLAEYMYLDPNAAVHKVSREIPAELAALFQPVAAGISWAHREPDTRVGDTVIIFGAGQRGLTSVIAAREAGAAQVFIIARRQSAHRLSLAREFGADEGIFADEDVVRRVRELTHGEGADVVLDVTAETMAPIPMAIEMAKAGATIVLAGVKGPGAYLERVEHDRIFAKELTVKGVKNADYRSFEIAIELIESGKYPLEKMHTHSFGLASLERALLTLAGRVPGENAVSVSINPAL